MRISEFVLEKWLNPLDSQCKYNLGASCVKALSIEELFTLIGKSTVDLNELLTEIKETELHYGDFKGLLRLKKAISKLYLNVDPNLVLTTHGGTGANSIVLTGLVEAEDNVVAILPTYQQHYSIPEAIGAETRILKLKEEDAYKINLDKLRELVDDNTKLISLTNPNNPTGAFIDKDELNEIVEIARSVGAYILCDEIYRGLDEKYMHSIVDLYEKGICTSSMSKVFSMAGTRVGWIVVNSQETYDVLENRRSYDSICNGVIDELIAAIAIENKDIILERSKKIVRRNREILDNWLPTQEHLTCAGKSYTSTALIRYSFDIPSDKLCEDILAKTGVLLCHGDCFEEAHSFRLGYGFGETETMEEALKLLGSYFKEMK